MIDRFNPLYWIETALHLPKVVLTYLGLPPESVFIKGALIIWWGIAGIVSILLVVYRPEIRQTIKDLVTTLVQ